MHEAKAVEVTPMANSGNGQAAPPPATLESRTREPRPVKPTSLGRFFEIVAAASLVGCFLLMGFNFESWLFFFLLLVGFMTISFGAYRMALWQARKAAQREQERRTTRKYKVTRRRLKTLEEIGVPEDILEALSYLLGQRPLVEDEFLDKIATDSHTDLGRDRANEFRETILRYTEADESPDTATTPSKSEAPPAAKKQPDNHGDRPGD